MEPEVQGEFDADFECARRAVELGWLTREQVEAAVLKAEGSPGLRLRSHLPFTPDQIRQLGLPPPPVPSELDPAADDPARRVAHYVLADQRWTGGMGHVVKAWDTRLSRWVALKFMKNLGGTRLRACFEQEARLAAGLIHPGIAAIHEIGEHEGAPFISMQFIEGRTFGEIRPRLKPREAARLIRDAARAVAFAHAQGIIHRDLKPSNLMIDATDRVYVMDFGLARRAEVSGPHRGPGRSMTISGTPEYISPEQARAGQTDERTDVHGLGATLYDLLTGRPPNRGKTPEEVLRSLRVADRLSPRRLNRNVDADLETIVLKCLAQDPAHRYPSATDLADDLERYLNRDAIAARRPSVTYRLRVRLAKRKVAVTAVVASLGLIGVLSWWFLVGSPAMEHTRLYADAMNLWAGVEKSTGAGGAPREIARKARKAREGFERALQVRGSSRAHLMKGRCLELEGHHNGALTEFERALDLEPGFTEARLQLAKVLMEKYQRSRGLPQTVIGLSKKGSLYFEQMPEETAEQVGIRERVKRLLQDSRPEPAHESLLRGLLAMGRGNHPEAAMAFAVYTEAERWDAQTMILQGICLYYSNDFEGAAGAMSRSLGRVETPSAFRWRGDVMRMRELHDDAISDYTKAIDMDPKFEKAYVGRGSARRDKGQLEDSIKDCDVAIALHPECTAAYFNRGNAKHDQGRYGEAIEDYSQAIELHPRHAEAFINRGNSKSRLGRREEALADYSKAIEMDSRQIKAYVNRGLQKVTFGLYNDAIADFDKALGLNPEHANAHNGRGMALHGKGQFSDALAALTRAIQLDPKDAGAYCNRGIIKRDMKLLDSAIADYDEALRLNPEFREAYMNRANARSAKGLHADAMADYETAIRLDPKHEASYYNRGRALEDRGEFEAAIADFNMAIGLGPPYARTYYARGNAKKKLGRLEPAIDDYKKAIKLDPKLVGALVNRGNALGALGHYDAAMRDFDEAISLEPKNAVAHENRGILKFYMSDYDGAIADSTIAIELDPKLAGAWHNRGEAQQKKGLHELAIEDYDAAIRLVPGNGEYYYRRAVSRVARNLRGPALEDFIKCYELAPQDRWASAYNIACEYALLGKKSTALEWLEKAVEAGWKDVTHIEKNSDLESLRGEERYRALVEKLKAK